MQIAFETAFFACLNVGYEKPSTEYFERVHEMAGYFDKQSAIVIGDSLTSDVLGGISFGTDTCWYNPKNKPLPKDFVKKPTYIVSNYSEILDIIL